MVHWRRTEFGYPFKSANSGIYDVNDTQNINNLKTCIQNYHKQNEETLEKVTPDFSNTTSLILGPLTGVLAGKFFTDAYFNPRYFYFKFFFIFGMGVLGYKWALNNKCHNDLAFVCRNFKNYPEEIKNALENMDWRYARKYQNLEK